MTLRIKPANLNDCPQLAIMNQQLITDEGSPNPMTLEQLTGRMTEFLKNDWTALWVTLDDVRVGYMLYQIRQDSYFPEKTEVYIRQYFILSTYRGRGIGRSALEMIVNEWFPQNAGLRLDVLSGNATALKFWESVGFQPYCVTMRR